MKLTTTKTVAITSTTPCTTRYSRLKIWSIRRLPDPGDREEHLDDDRAADEGAEVDGEHGQQGERRGPERVPEQDVAGREALRARHEDEVLLQRGDEVAAQQARVDGGQAGDEHEQRQGDRAQVLDQPLLGDARVAAGGDPRRAGSRR